MDSSSPILRVRSDVFVRISTVVTNSHKVNSCFDDSLDYLEFRCLNTVVFTRLGHFVNSHVSNSCIQFFCSKSSKLTGEIVAD
jgi:hypothetical protein